MLQRQLAPSIEAIKLIEVSKNNQFGLLNRHLNTLKITELDTPLIKLNIMCCSYPKNKNCSTISFNSDPTSTLNNKKAWLGLSRAQCQRQLAQHHLKSISFAQWLSIPKLGLLLIFKHQQCVILETFDMIS